MTRWTVWAFDATQGRWFAAVHGVSRLVAEYEARGLVDCLGIRIVPTTERPVSAAHLDDNRQLTRH